MTKDFRQRHNMRKKYIYILVPIIIVFIGLMAVLLTIMFVKPNTRAVFSENMSAAVKYMSQNDYTNAIFYYKEAIKANAADEEAYIGLADAYEKSGQHENAVKTLEIGYERTKSAKIRSLLEKYINPIDNDDGNVDNTGNILSVDTKPDSDDELRINDTLFEILSSYNYQKYRDVYSIQSEDRTSDGDIIVKYPGLDLEFYYNDTDKAVNIDSLTGKPKNEAFPYKIVAPSMKSLFSGVKDGIIIDDIRNLPGITESKVSMNNEIRNNVVEFKYKDCHILVESSADGNITKLDGWNRIIPEADNSGNCTFRGTVKDAVNYSVVYSSINIYARQGENNRVGQIVAQTTAENGEFLLSIPAGDYTLELSAGGYVRDYYNIYVSGGGENQKDLVVSPSIASGTMRVVLTWGSVPRDLDGHLIGISSENRDVHVYWIDKVDRYNVANLDVDHISGNGCETITINDINGVYTYKVHRYSSDGSISSSGAVVKVYTSDGQVRTFTPTSSTDAVLWNVFSIDKGNIIPISGNVE